MSNSEKFNSAASQAKAKADELITKATPVVTDAAEKVGEYASKAGVAAAGHVDGVAASLKSVTGGRGAEQIDKFAPKLKSFLRRGEATPEAPEAPQGDSPEPPPSA
jgi:hypothetical protein